MAEEKSSGGQFVKVEVIAQIFGVTVPIIGNCYFTSAVLASAHE